jgi:hypothetical protein
MEAGMKEIDVAGGFTALVDDDNYARLVMLYWHGHPGGNRWYPVRAVTISSGQQRVRFMHSDIIDCPPGMMVDHINLDPMDNRRENLRICTAQQNAFNRSKRSGSASPYKGVWRSRHGKRWVAVVTCGGRDYHEGTYGSQEEAAMAYDRRAAVLFGEFARLNFPNARREWVMAQATESARPAGVQIGMFAAMGA